MAGPEDIHDDEPHLPPPTLWPLGFAIGVAVLLVGLIVDPKRDVIVSEGPLDHLDHAPERQFFGGKLGIDATAKWPEEGARPWPEEIEMSAEIKELVTRRWAEYGLG